MTHPTPKPFTIVLPKRYCANSACKRLLPENHPRNYTTCSWKCKQSVDAEIARVEAADKLPQVKPF